MSVMDDSFNGSQLNSVFEESIVIFHHSSGALFLVVNFIVFLLIAFDNDNRNKSYRKYLLMLQGFSSLTDFMLSVGVPIMIVNFRIIYAVGFIPFNVRMTTCMIFFVISFGEVINCYFSCVYYRRNIIMPDDARFRYTGWKKVCLLVGIRLTGLLVYSVVYYLILRDETPIEEIPPSALWIQSKPCAILLKIDIHLYLLAFVMLAWGMPVFTLISLIVRQLSRELKHGMFHASSSTKRYQRRAVTSLMLQGTVPGIVYIFPILSEFSILFYSTIAGKDSISPTIVSMVSAVLFNLFSLHTFVHSITILACTPSYQRTLIGIVTRRKISPPVSIMKVSEWTHKGS